MLLFAATAG